MTLTTMKRVTCLARLSHTLATFSLKCNEMCNISLVYVCFAVYSMMLLSTNPSSVLTYSFSFSSFSMKMNQLLDTIIRAKL